MHPFLLSLLVAAVLLFISCINTAGSTTVSREGPMFFFLRTIPVSPARQAAAKFLFAYSVLALTSLLMTLVSVFVLQLPAMATLLGLALALVCGVAPIALSMLPDFLRPKLAWNSETEAIKQNMCAVLAMFIGWGYLALLGVGCYFALRALEPQWVCALAALSCALLGVISLYLALPRRPKKLAPHRRLGGRAEGALCRRSRRPEGGEKRPCAPLAAA